MAQEMTLSPENNVTFKNSDEVQVAKACAFTHAALIAGAGGITSPESFKAACQTSQALDTLKITPRNDQICRAATFAINHGRHISNQGLDISDVKSELNDAIDGASKKFGKCK